MNQVDAPVCLECGDYIVGYAAELEQKVCSDCQEALDAKA
jgi:NMD protein affecting ribosome stability and mRNA decay